MATATWARSESCTVRPLVPNILIDYIRYRQITVDFVLDLWPKNGQLLHQIFDQLNCTEAVGILPNSQDVDHFEKEDVRFRPVLANPKGIEQQSFPPPDLVLGVPPWHWKPAYINRIDDQGDTVQLTDDPANVALIDACRRLAQNGLGCFIVGAGVLMRPGPGAVLANLARFGLHIDGVIALPRGSTSPDLGAGQALLAVSKTKREPQFLGRLRPGDTKFADVVPS